MRELTVQEARQVNGGIGFAGAAIGAAAGAAYYAGHTITSGGSFSWGGFAQHTINGAALGAFGGASAMTAYVLPRLGFGLGVAWGLSGGGRSRSRSKYNSG